MNVRTALGKFLQSVSQSENPVNLLTVDVVFDFFLFLYIANNLENVDVMATAFIAFTETIKSLQIVCDVTLVNDLLNCWSF